MVLFRCEKGVRTRQKLFDFVFERRTREKQYFLFWSDLELIHHL